MIALVQWASCRRNPSDNVAEGITSLGVINKGKKVPLNLCNKLKEK